MLEIERLKKVVNMMITSHSILRDRYLQKAAIFENALLVSSVVLNALVFVDAKFITVITSITEEGQKLIIGIASIIVFAISIVLLQVKWKERAEAHSKASEELFKLKQLLRDIYNLDEGLEKQKLLRNFKEKYTQIVNSLIKIPDKTFNSLKLIHYRKLELSHLIDTYPGSRLFILKFRIFISSFKKNITHDLY